MLDETTTITSDVPLFQYHNCLYAHVRKGQEHQIREYSSNGLFLRESNLKPFNKLTTLTREDKYIMAATEYFKDNNFPVNTPFVTERFQNWEGNL